MTLSERKYRALCSCGLSLFTFDPGHFPGNQLSFKFGSGTEVDIINSLFSDHLYLYRI